MASPLSKGIVAIMLSAVFATPSLATIYIKIDGVDGGVTETSHPGWIEVHRYVCMSSAPASPVWRRDFSFSKTPDAASAKLQKLAANNVAIGTVTVHVSRSEFGPGATNSGAPTQTALEYALENAKIDSYESRGITAGGTVLDLVKLKAEKITWKTSDGRAGDGCGH